MIYAGLLRLGLDRKGFWDNCRRIGHCRWPRTANWSRADDRREMKADLPVDQVVRAAQSRAQDRAQPLPALGLASLALALLTLGLVRRPLLPVVAVARMVTAGTITRSRGPILEARRLRAPYAAAHFGLSSPGSVSLLA
jgi:hypothetical protein